MEYIGMDQNQQYEYKEMERCIKEVKEEKLKKKIEKSKLNEKNIKS
jgi:heme oxygenase